MSCLWETKGQQKSVGIPEGAEFLNSTRIPSQVGFHEEAGRVLVSDELVVCSWFGFLSSRVSPGLSHGLGAISSCSSTSTPLHPGSSVSLG